MRRVVGVLVGCVLAMLLVLLPVGAQEAAEPPVLVTTIDLGGIGCDFGVAVAGGKVLASCERTAGRGLVVASPGAPGESWIVDPEVALLRPNSDYVAVRSSVLFTDSGGAVQIMNVGGSTPTFEEIVIPGDPFPVGASAAAFMDGRERFAVPFGSFGDVSVSVVTSVPLGPPGPDGSPTGGGWEVQSFPVPSLSSVSSTAVLNDHVYLTNRQQIVEVSVLDPQDQRLVYEVGESQTGGVVDIGDILADSPNGRLLALELDQPIFAVPQKQQVGDPISPSTYPVVVVDGSSGHLQERPDGSTVLFEWTRAQVLTTDIRGAVQESFLFLDEDLVNYRGVAGARELLAVRADEGQSALVQVYDLTGWVAPSIPADALPQPDAVTFDAVLFAGATSSHPVCLVQVEAPQAGYCFATTEGRQTYITAELLGNPQYGTVWIGRFDEEVVAP